MGTLSSELAPHAERLTARPRIYADANVPAGLVNYMRVRLRWDVLFVLEDDKHYFPPYEAVPIIRQETMAHHPELKPALDELAGKISDAEMRQLNYAVDGQHRDVKQVVREFLQAKTPSAK